VIYFIEYLLANDVVQGLSLDKIPIVVGEVPRNTVDLIDLILFV